MNRDCEIVKDLLPLYAEGLTRGGSAAFVRAHLETCPDCAAELARIRQPAAAELEREARAAEAAPLTAVKRRLEWKRVVIILSSAVLTLAAATAVLVMLAVFRPVDVDYGTSELYSQEDMDAAVRVIRQKFAGMRGCKLYSLRYASDERCLRELESRRGEAPDGTAYTDCIVFDSVFRSPLAGGGAWNRGELYTWSWTLVRTDGGPWKLLTWGYA